MNRRLSISDDEIVRKFRFGLKKACAKAIWRSIQNEVVARIGGDGRDVSQEQVAAYFHLQRSDVNKGLAEGSLSLESLVTMLTQLDWNFGHLDRAEIPDKQARTLMGYQEAIRHLRSRELGTVNDTIPHAAFFSLCALYADGQYFRLDLKDKLDDKAWESILERVLPKIAVWLGLSAANIEHLPYRTIPQFKDLRQRWGKAVARCLNAIPHRGWLEFKS
jgi:predicted XRE-type DNA-binding protein